MDYKITSMNLAAINLKSMVDFYANVFNIQFEEQNLNDAKLYVGKFAGVEFVLLPAELANVTAKQNRMQYDFLVDDIQWVIDAVTQYGGRTNGQLVEDEYVKCIGVYDPDENFMVFKQKIRAVAT